MKIDFQKLCLSLDEAGLLTISPTNMTEEQVKQLCRIVRLCTTDEQEGLRKYSPYPLGIHPGHGCTCPALVPAIDAACPLHGQGNPRSKLLQ